MKSALVTRFELLTLLHKPAYLMLAFGLPLIGVAILAGLTLTRPVDEAEPAPAAPAAVVVSEGYVDLAGIVDQLPPDVPQDSLVRYSDEPEARRALQAGDISAYYIGRPRARDRRRVQSSERQLRVQRGDQPDAHHGHDLPVRRPDQRLFPADAQRQLGEAEPDD